MKKSFLVLLVFVSVLIGSTHKTVAQIDPFIGQIILVPYTFVPRGWAECDGRLLPIAQNQALYSLIGNTYGGDGRNTFALPDLRGRVPVGLGQGAGLSNYTLGQTGGEESVTLTSMQLPAHTHGVGISTANGTTNDASAGFLANTGDLKEYSVTPNASNPVMIQPAGHNQPHENRAPFIGMRYIIAVEGMYPDRN